MLAIESRNHRTGPIMSDCLINYGTEKKTNENVYVFLTWTRGKHVENRRNLGREKNKVEAHMKALLIIASTILIKSGKATIKPLMLIVLNRCSLRFLRARAHHVQSRQNRQLDPLARAIYVNCLITQKE